MKKEIRKICKEVGVEIEIEDLRRIKTGREEWGQLVVVKLKSEEARKKILENKSRLKGREIWIEEDQTFREWKIKWKLKRIAEEEVRKGKKSVFRIW